MTEPQLQPQPIHTPGRSAAQAAIVDYLGMVAALALLVAVFGLLTRHFFSVTTFRTIASQIPDAVIAAVGMTFVLIIAGIDLSVGSVLALSSAVVGVCIVQFSLPVPVAILAGLVTGVLCGLINGAVSVAWRLPSFIVTLGMLEIARGATYLVTDSQTQYIGSPIEPIAAAALFGVPLPFLLAVGIVVLGQLLLSRTVFGRYMIAIGTNEEAVRLSGIDPRPIKVAVFALCGLLVAVAAVLQTSRLASADPNAGSGFELQIIAAVVIGGTSLMGGRGSVVRSFFGVLIIAVLGAGLAQVGAREHTKRLITGCVIVGAVILDYYRQRLKRAPR
jgi:ribose transport system permease protein